MLPSIQRFLTAPVFEDEEKTRTAFLLNTISIFILMALFFGAILGPLLSSMVGEQITYAQAFIQIQVRGGFLIFLAMTTLILIRLGFVRQASILFLVAAWLLVFMNTYRTGGVQSPVFYNFLLVIIIAGLFMGTRATIITAILSFLAGGIILYLANQNRIPTSEIPTASASFIAGGISFSIAALFLSLYVRRLKETFEQLKTANNKLEVAGKDLEKNVVERTRALASSAEISRRLSTILDPNQLMAEVVEQIKTAYNYYHGQIYLLDDSKKTLILAGATGEVGKTLLAQGYRMPVDRGLSGRVARTRTGLLVPDTSKEPDWVPNPLLPNTKSEVAVPIKIGDQLIGVLEMQDDMVGDVYSEDVDLLQAIANQVAIALQNARQYEETQILFHASQTLATATSYQDMLNAFMENVAPHSDQGGLLVFNSNDQDQLIAADYVAAWSRETNHPQPVAIGTRFAPEQIPFVPFFAAGQPLIVSDSLATTPGPQTATPEIARVLTQFGVQSLAGFPLILNGKLLGALLFGYAHPHTFTESELQPVQTIASQMAVLLRNQQLLAESQATLAQLDMINRRLTGEGWREFTKLTGGLMIEDIAPGIAQSALETNVQSTQNGHHAKSTEITAPIIVRGEEIGRFSLQPFDDATAFSDEGLDLLQAVADEVAVSLENMRLLEETQQNALALEESRNLLDSVVENLPLLLFVKEAKELRYVRWNKVGEEMLGITAAEVLGKNAYDSFSKEDADRFTAQDWEILSGEDFLDISEETVETPRGTRILHTRKTPVFGPDGQARFLIGLSEDITEQKQAEKALQDLEALYRRAIASADAVPYSRRYTDESFSFVGEGIEDLTGYPAEEFSTALFDSMILETKIYSITNLPHPNAVQLTRSGKAASWKADYRMRGRDGKERWVSDSSVEIIGPDGTSIGSVGIMTDITERKRAEEALSRQLKEMENLNNIGQIIATQQDLETLLVMSGEKICETFNVDSGYVALYDTRSEILQIPFYLNFGQRVNMTPKPLGIGLASRVVRSRQTLLIPEMTKETAQQLGAYLVGENSPVSWLGVPILSSGEVIGVVSVQHGTQPNWFKESDVQLLNTIAASLSTAIQNIRLLEQTQATLAELEQLTRRLTREGWQEYVDTMAEEIGYVYDLNRVEPLLASSPMHGNGSATMEQSLFVQGETIGRLVIAESETLDYEMSELVTAVSHQLSAHLENLRLLEETERARQQLRLQSTALESAANAIVITDRKGEVLWVNPAFTTLTGYASHEAVGGNPRVLKSGAQDRDFYRNMWETVLDGRVWTGELVNRRKDGTDYLEEMTITPLRSTGGEVTHFIAIKTDITARKEAEEALAKRATELATVAEVGTASATLLNPDELLQTVVDLTKSSFGLYHAHIYLFNDAQDTLILSNGAGEIGYQMVIKGWHIPLDREKSLVARAARTRTGVIANDVIDDPDYLPNPLLPNTRSELAVPLIVGEKALGVLDVQAETAYYFTEDDKRIYITLASQIAVALQNARLYVEQAATVQRLRELDHLKSSFLANMSHELRTPLNSIIGFTEIILEEIDGPLTEYMEGDLKIIQKNGKHLLSLINDVLDMAKIEAGRMNLSYERFMFSELLEDVVDITSSLAHDKRLYLKIESDDAHETELLADRIRLRQVLINVVGNAVKFTETGGVTLRSQKKDGKLWLQVIDTGIGIPPEKLDTVFDHFSQVDTSTTRKAGGTGLGLPISRRLVELHQGQLFAESSGAEGEGSIFNLILPLEPTASSQA